MADPTAAQAPTTLKGLDRLYRGFQCISHKAFLDGMAEAFGSRDDEYANNQWGRVRDNPIGWCISRSPARQGEVMLALAIGLARDLTR